MDENHRTYFLYASFVKLAVGIVSVWTCGSFVEVDFLGSSRRTAVMCEMKLAKILRQELTAAQRMRMHLMLTCMPHFFGTNVFVFPAVNGLLLGSLYITRRLMCLLLPLECR